MPGLIVGLLSALGMFSNMAGHPVLGTFLHDPGTAATITQVVSGVAAIAAGVMKGLHK